MKIRLVIFILILFISCKKEKVQEPIVPIQNHPLVNPNLDTTKGKLSMLVNGVYWQGGVSITEGNKFSITAIFYKTRNNYYYPWESFSLFKMQKNQLHQTIYKTDSLLNTNPDLAKTSGFFSTSQGDGDVSCENFAVWEKDSINNSVIITNQINNYSEVFGSFKLTVIKSHNCNEAHYQDTIKITNGYFHVYLK